MSAKETNNQHDLSGLGQSDPKTAREAQQRKQEKRSNLIYGTIAVVFALVAILAIVWRSNLIPKTVTATTINGESYTAAEVNFYFVNTYQTFLSNNYSYISYLGLNVNEDLRDQAYGDDQTWFDYFLDQAMMQMSEVQALNDAAAADGYTWNDELQAQMDSSMEALATNAANAGYTTKQYLGLIFGSTMSEKIYTEQMQRTILAQGYAMDYEASLTYTEDQLTEAYNADVNAYDKVSYEVVRVSGTASSTDADGNAVEVTDAMSAQAMADAKIAADAIYASHQAGTSLEALAENYETATYSSSDTGAYSESVLMDWLFDDSRRAGDSAVLEDADSAYYYVVAFRDRFREDYNTVNVRHILIQPEAGALAEGEEGYEEEQAQLQADARATAEELLAQWQAGDATEEAFATLANENSVDGGSNTNGGLYEQIYQGQMVTAFNDWCFASGRKTGDTGIVETDYGYHIMYFVGTDLPYWQVQVNSNLAVTDFNSWYEDKTEGYTSELSSFGTQFVKSSFAY